MNIKATAFMLATALGATSLPIAAQEITWELANEYGKSSIMGVGDEAFIKAVDELSDGMIEVTPHYDGSIGYKSVDQFDAVGDGAIEIADTVMGAVAGIEPIFLLSSLPFIAGSDADAKLLFEVARPTYEEVFAKHNQVLLWATPWPPSGIWANSPITSQEELAALKIRAWDPSGVQTMSNAGANAVQISWADTVPQLASGAINAVLTSADGGVSVKFWEFLSNFTAVNYSMALNMVHMNKDVYDSLTEEQQQIVMQAAQVASDAAWAELGKRIAKNYEEMRANGVEITESVSPEFRASLVDSGEQVYADWLEKTGETGQSLLDEYRSKLGQ
ncbi:TRAP transporter substrate-binding protein [Paracoccus saliphilus]|uniref:TRAP transporter substrate-binding protein n=1 Tax=Paracoccus saliphilus TaxID=405559 RepID=A0AA46A5Z9_9RHOB|nr:TRAP transporter substrate-binding protein [Paracoccus saliphilus]WCR02122.1 TRAP transporter substrate-binding protein [Paracoccus saliphilus]SIS90244.1 TRAP-type C4-dicarboxylate transport system, substrate-binding protein [Paracoccus saliphilus]